MSSVRPPKLGKVKSFLPFYILLKVFHRNTVDKADQSSLAAVQTCMQISMGVSRQKEK